MNDKPRQKLHVRNYEQKKQFKKRPEQEQATGLSVKVVKLNFCVVLPDTEVKLIGVPATQFV